MANPSPDDLTAKPAEFVSVVTYSSNSETDLSGGMKLATWNLEYFPYAGSYLSKTIHDTSGQSSYFSLVQLESIFDYRDINVENFRKSMKELLPTFACFQEVAHSELLSRALEDAGYKSLVLVRHVTDDKHFFGTSGDAASANVLQTMAIASRFEIDDDDVWLIDFSKVVKGDIPPRGVLACKVEVPGSLTKSGQDTAVVVYNVHLKSNVADGLTDSQVNNAIRTNIRKRERAIEYLQADIKKRKELYKAEYGDNIAFVVMGDFNTTVSKQRITLSPYTIGQDVEETMTRLLGGAGENNPESLFHVSNIKTDAMGKGLVEGDMYVSWKGNKEADIPAVDFDHIVVNKGFMQAFGIITNSGKLVVSNKDGSQLPLQIIDDKGSQVTIKGRKYVEAINKVIPRNDKQGNKIPCIPPGDVFVSDHSMVLASFN